MAIVKVFDGPFAGESVEWSGQGEHPILEVGFSPPVEAIGENSVNGGPARPREERYAAVREKRPDGSGEWIYKLQFK